MTGINLISFRTLSEPVRAISATLGFGLFAFLLGCSMIEAQALVVSTLLCAVQMKRSLLTRAVLLPAMATRSSRHPLRKTT